MSSHPANREPVPPTEAVARSRGWSGMRSARRVLLVVCAVMGLVLSSVSALLVANYDTEVRRQDLERHDAIVSSRFSSYLQTATDALEAVRPLWHSDPDATEAEFLSFVRAGVGARDDDPSSIAAGITQFSFIRAVDPGEVPAFLEQRRRQRPYSFRHDLDPGAPHYVVDYSVRDDWQVRGIDLYPLPDRRVALQRARDTGMPSATSWATSVADRRLPPTDRRHVASVYVPVYGPGPDPDTVMQRRERIVGWLAAVFSAQDLADSLARDLPIGLEIRDPVDGEGVLASVDSDAVRGSSWRTKTYRWAGGTWLVHTAPATRARPQELLFAPYTTLAVGLGVTALVVAFLYVVMASGDRAEWRATQAMAERDRSERSLQVLAEHVPIGIVDLDADGTVRWMNSHLRKLLGLRCSATTASKAPVECATLTWPLLAHPDGADVVTLRWADAYATRSALTARRRILRPDGEARWIDERGVPILDDEGELVRWVVSVTDVDAEVEFERQLQFARDQALEASRLKSEFVANMSHEIRTPLNGIIGMADLLLDTELDAVQRDRVATLRQAAWQQLDLLNDLLDLSKIEAGRLTLEHIPFSPRELVESVVRLYSSKAYDKGVALRHEVGDGVPGEVMGDPLRVRQIIGNLVGNAVKFTECGTVAVQLRVEEHVGDRARLRFDVVDSGIGIPRDAQALLFEPFAQADTSTTRTYGGTGLGLTICRQLADLMGATLEMESAPGSGSRFSLVVELAVAEALPAAAVDPDPSPVVGPATGTAPATWLGHEVLLVEDNPINQQVAKGLLGRLGCDVTVAADGIEALNVLAEQPFPIVFMDCQMPRMDGLEATTRLRRLPGGDRAYVIAMTASAMEGDRARCLAAGMDDYLPKPVTLAALEATLLRAGSLILPG